MSPNKLTQLLGIHNTEHRIEMQHTDNFVHSDKPTLFHVRLDKLLQECTNLFIKQKYDFK